MSGFGFGTRSGLHRASGSRNGPRVALSAFTLPEDTQPGSTLGTLSVVAGSGTYSFSIPAGGDPDEKFAVSGSDLVTTDTFDFEISTFHQVTVEADNGVDPIVSRGLIIAVTNVFEQPDLGPLSIAGTVAQGSTIPIGGAAAGSTIVAPVFPTGWALDAFNRTVAIATDAPIGAQNWSLIETLNDASNSPNVSSGASTVESAGAEAPLVIIASLGQSNETGNEALRAQDVDVPGIFQYASNPNDPATLDQTLSDITPLLHPLVGAPESRLGFPDYFNRTLFTNDVFGAGANILIVPCARPGSGLTPAGQRWYPFAGEEGENFTFAIAQINKAIAAAQLINPASYFAGFTWTQGENDAGRGVSIADYKSAFLEMRRRIRTEVTGASNAWAVLGSMVPEWVNGNLNREAIEEAQKQLAAENSDVFYYQSPDGIQKPNDTIHFTNDGQETRGTQAAGLLPGWIAGTNTLSELSVPTIATQDMSIAITGAATGSTLEVIGVLPTGWTLDSASREFALAPDAATGSQDWSLREILAAAPNNNRISIGSTTVNASAASAPVLSLATGTQTGQTTAWLTVTTDAGNGTLYGAATTSPNTPSAAQIKAGQDHTGGAANFSGSKTLTATGPQTIGATSLVANTQYFAHFVQEDAQATPLTSNTISSVGFTTAATSFTFTHTEAEAYVDAMTAEPTDARKAVIDTLVGGLKADGVWSKLGPTWIHAAHDAQAARINLTTPASLTLPATGYTFTADQGWTGTGADMVDTGIDENGDGVFTNSLSASMFVWVEVAGADGEIAIGQFDNRTRTFLNPKLGNGSMRGQLGTSTNVQGAVPDRVGLSVVNRTSGGALQLYRDTALVANEAGPTSATPDPGNFVILGGDNDNFATDQISVSGFGGDLTATDVANLFARLNAYRIAIGAA